ncbi:MAG: hypothetical protein AAGJ10_13060 [Bacteroidota bacterium]
MKHHRPAHLFAALLLLLLGVHASHAQTSSKQTAIQHLTPPPTYEALREVTLDLRANSFKGSLPFDEPFFITGKVPKGVSRVYMRYEADVPKLGRRPIETWWDERFKSETEFAVPVLPLEPNQRYTFSFTFCTNVVKSKPPAKKGSTDAKQDSVAKIDSAFHSLIGAGLPDSLTAVQDSLQALTNRGEGCEQSAGRGVRDARVVIPQPFGIRTTETNTDTFVNPDFGPSALLVSGYTKAAWTDHFVSDVGTLYAPKAGYYFGLYTGLHLHLVPVKRDAELHGFDPLKRFSVFTGLVVTNLGGPSDNPVINRTAIGNPVVGAGFRAPFFWRTKRDLDTSTPHYLWYQQIFMYSRINAGWLFYAQDDPNPLVTKNRNRADFFVSLTVDFKPQTILGPLAGLFAK